MDFAFSVLFLKFHLIHSLQVEDFERSNVTLLFFFKSGHWLDLIFFFSQLSFLYQVAVLFSTAGLVAKSSGVVSSLTLL